MLMAAKMTRAIDAEALLCGKHLQIARRFVAHVVSANLGLSKAVLTR
jgi:hypothetical protein